VPDATTIVTGGAGFLGSHLVAVLAERGERVWVLDKPGRAADHLDGVAERVIDCDIRDRSAVAAVMREAADGNGLRHVYHLAANPGLWLPDASVFDAVNHRGAVHVLESAVAAGAERVLHCSTESILFTKEHGGTPPDVETRSLDAAEMPGAYCLSKMRGERAALDLAAAGHPVVVVNPTIPVGPGDRSVTNPTRLALDFLRGKLPAIVDCAFNLTDARDIAAMMAAAIERGQPGRRYILGGHNVMLSDYLALLAEHVDHDPPRKRVPYAVALAYAHAAQALARLTRQAPAATVTGVRLTRFKMHFDATGVHAELGVTPRPLAESVADAVAWYREQGWLDSTPRQQDAER